MKKLKFTIEIDAPVSLVFDKMLGLTDISTYEQWTKEFNATSSIIGKWEKGSKMLFVGMDEEGNQGGMVSEIAECIKDQFVSIRHYGILENGKEITSGPDVEKWANSYENYTFEEQGKRTLVKVDVDIIEEYEAYMNEAYPKALAQLKRICEL